MMLSGIGARLAIGAVTAAVSIGAYLMARVVVLRKAGRVSLLSGLFAPGKPGVIFFTTPDCVACKTVQRPALNALKERLDGRIQIIEVDALDRPDLASSWSVLSVPTTFVLDRDGKPLHVNHGVASTRKLLGQLPQET
jgi:thiol-disulfide isomerase/thioredoxin